MVWLSRVNQFRRFTSSAWPRFWAALVRSWGRNSRMTECCTTRSIAAAVAIGLAKMRSHSEKTRLDVMPSDLRS